MAQGSNKNDELKKRLKDSKNTEMDKVKYLYHVTTNEKCKIIEQQKEENENTIIKDWDKIGILTTVHVDQDNQLQSPYGEKQFLFEIKKICNKPEEWELFFLNTYHIRKKNKPFNQYIKLVLVKKGEKAVNEWCQENLVRLELDRNPFFTISENGKAQAIQCRVERLCRGCENPVKSCEKKDRCHCSSCSCNMSKCTKGRKCKRTTVKLKLFVEVFIVDGILASEKTCVRDVKNTGRGSKFIFKLPPKYCWEEAVKDEISTDEESESPSSNEKIVTKKKREFFYNTLKKRLEKSKNKKMDEEKYFYHVTTKKNYKKIKQNYGTRLARSTIEDCHELKGLWTTVSLVQNNKLKSRYGEKQILFKIKEICNKPKEWKLFFQNTYYIRGTAVTPTKQYIKLVLVKEDDKLYDMCKGNLEELKLESKGNPYFTISEDGKAHAIQRIVERLCCGCHSPVKSCEKRDLCYCSSCDKNMSECRKCKRNTVKLKLFVEVIIVGGIPASNVCDVKDVEYTGTKIRELPKKECFFEEEVRDAD